MVATTIILVLAAAFAVYVAYDIGKMNGEMQGWKHTSHARRVHMQDLSNVHALIVRNEDPGAAADYVRMAIGRIECKPSADQELPAEVRG